MNNTELIERLVELERSMVERMYTDRRKDLLNIAE